MDRIDLWGLEFDWLATDGDGHVACFASAGYGEIPLEILETARLDDLLDIGQLVTQLRATGGAVIEGRGPGSCETYRRLGERGIFVYDWYGLSGPYERIIAPEHKIHLRDLSPPLASRALPLHGVVFAENVSFDAVQIRHHTR